MSSLKPNEHSLGASWFNRPAPESHPPQASAIESSGDVAAFVPTEGEGRLGWALALGGMTGALGGVAMIFTASELAHRLRFGVDIIRTVGNGRYGLGGAPLHVAIVLAATTGAVVGLLFGALMRYSVRRLARVLAGILLATVLWIVLQAFVFKPLTPTSFGALPFGPMIAGAAVYGLCIAIVRPPRKRFDQDD